MLSTFSFFTLWPPTFLLITAIAFAIYMYICGPGSKRPATKTQLTYFLTALFCFWLGTGTPIHIIGETYLMSAHMITSLLLNMAMPPLIILATPNWVIERAMQNRAVRFTLKLLTKPLVAFGAYNMVFMLWHTPGMYDMAIRSDYWHGVQEASLFITGLMGWMPLVSRSPELPRLSDPLQMLYTFLCIVLQTFLYGPLMIATEPLFEVYRFAPRLIPGLSALEDQQLGHLFMGVLNPFVLGGIFTAAFVRMVRADEKSTV